MPQDVSRRPRYSASKPKESLTQKKEQQQKEQKQRSTKAKNVKHIMLNRSCYSVGSCMKGDITIKSVVLLLLLPTILYTVVIITLFIGIPQPTMRDMPSCNRAKLLNTNECDATVQVDVCNRIINKLKTFKRSATRRNKKKKKKKRCPKREGESSFKMREDPVGEMERYLLKAHDD